MTEPAYPPSPSGYYRVNLMRTFPHMGFDYKPGADHTVNEELLQLMLAEEGLLDGQPVPA